MEGGSPVQGACALRAGLSAAAKGGLGAGASGGSGEQICARRALGCGWRAEVPVSSLAVGWGPILAPEGHLPPLPSQQILRALLLPENGSSVRCPGSWCFE